MVSSREIKSPGYPGGYPVEKACKWDIRIPKGTFFTIERFGFSFDCDNVDDKYQDFIRTEGFVGGTTYASQRVKCKGMWENTTSSAEKLQIDFKSDDKRDFDVKNPRFLMAFSLLKRKLRYISINLCRI